MAKRNLRKVLLMLTAAATLLAGTATMCFADEKTTPVHITVPVTAIDITVTERINMAGASNSEDLTVTSLIVTNNGDMGVLKIDSIKATAASGWSIVGSTADFAKMGANAKKVALVADGTHEMTAEYNAAGEIDPGQTDTTTFVGKTGMVTSAITDTKVADIVTTVSFK